MSQVADSDDEFWQAKHCFEHTGIPVGTWRHWAHVNEGPRSFTLGRRRVWRKSVVLAWIAEQEAASCANS
ncbi:DNA-binding protein [Rhodococcus hoagii]|nr:DNA-binding protein [Prescottella equi]NKS73475.1 DNA-binding protein [Prescottella equi]NKZ92250.1 DNA-binding protein [Prescottella equi]